MLYKYNRINGTGIVHDRSKQSVTLSHSNENDSATITAPAIW